MSIKYVIWISVGNSYRKLIFDKPEKALEIINSIEVLDDWI